MSERNTSVQDPEYPDFNVKVESSKWGRINAVGAIGGAVLGIAATVLFINSSNENSASKFDEREEYRLEQMQSNEYEISAEPLETRPEPAGNLGRMTSPIVPVCRHESATLMVDSILAESYIKGLDESAIRYVSQHEFPEIHIYGLPECGPEDVARINVPDALGKG